MTVTVQLVSRRANVAVTVVATCLLQRSSLQRQRRTIHGNCLFRPVLLPFTRAAQIEFGAAPRVRSRDFALIRRIALMA